MITPEFVKHSGELGKLVNLRHEFGKTYEIRELESIRWLLINNTLQTIVHREHPEYFQLPHLQKLEQIWTKLPDPKTILEVGLGGGAIRNYCLDTYSHCTIDTIEIDPVILELYQQYFALPNQQGVLVQNDINTHTFGKKYDWIIVDLFSQQACPTFLFHPDFYIHIKQASKIGCWLFINFICDNAQQLERLIAILTEVFSSKVDVHSIEHYANKIIVLNF